MTTDPEFVAPWQKSEDRSGWIFSESQAGKPAKEAKEISRTLKSLHAANEANVAGDTTADKTLWVRAAEFEYRWQANGFRWLLKRQRIAARLVRRASRYFVEVQRRDLDAALAILRDHPPPKIRPGREWLYRPWLMLHAAFYVLILLPVAIGVVLFTLVDASAMQQIGAAAGFFTILIVTLEFCFLIFRWRQRISPTKDRVRAQANQQQQGGGDNQHS